MSSFYPDATNDAQGPEEYDAIWRDECFFCEGSGLVLVAKVYDLDGKAVDTPEHRCSPEIPCPWCK